MRSLLLWLLAALNVALGCVLGWLWLTPELQPREFRWQRPSPVVPAPALVVPRSLGSADDATRQFLLSLERPVFSPSRRPPPPPPPPKVEVPDPLASLQLLGIVDGDDFSGVLARIDGKVRRVRRSELVGEWTLTQLEDRRVTFIRGAETRTIRLNVSRAGGALPGPASVGRGGAASGSAGLASEAGPNNRQVRVIPRVR